MDLEKFKFIEEIKIDYLAISIFSFYFLSTVLNPFFSLKYLRLIGDFLLIFSFFLFLKNILGKKINLVAMDIIIFLLFILSIIGIFYAKYGSDVFLIKGFYTGYFPIVAYFLGRLFNNKKDIVKVDKIIRFLLVIGIISILWGLRQFFFPFDKEIAYSHLPGTGGMFLGDYYAKPQDKFRVFSIFISSVHFANFLILIQVLLLYFKSRKLISNKIYYFYLILLTAGLVFSFSRTFFITFFITYVLFFVWAVFFLKENQKVNGIKLAVGSILISLLTFSVLLKIPLVKNRYSTLIGVGRKHMIAATHIKNKKVNKKKVKLMTIQKNPRQKASNTKVNNLKTNEAKINKEKANQKFFSKFELTGFKKINSFKTRLKLWKMRIKDIKKRPFWGYGTGIAGFHMRIPKEQYLICDNYYLKILVELGVIGFLLFVLIYLYVFKIFFSYDNSMIILTLFYMVLLIPMITNQVLEAFPINIFFFFFLGILVSFNNLKGDRDEI